MQSEIAQFLRYLSVERNASELTVKSYREDLFDLAEYLLEELGADVQTGWSFIARPARLRGSFARSGIRANKHLAQVSIAAKFLSFRTATPTCPIEPSQTAAESSRATEAAALLNQRRSRQTPGSATNPKRYGSARSRDS